MLTDAKRALVAAARDGLSVRAVTHDDPTGGGAGVRCWHLVRWEREPRARGGFRWVQRPAGGCHATVGQAVDALLAELREDRR